MSAVKKTPRHEPGGCNPPILGEELISGRRRLDYSRLLQPGMARRRSSVRLKVSGQQQDEHHDQQ